MLRINTAKNTAKNTDAMVIAVLRLFLQMLRQASFINKGLGFRCWVLGVELFDENREHFLEFIKSSK